LKYKELVQILIDVSQVTGLRNREVQDLVRIEMRMTLFLASDIKKQTYHAKWIASSECPNAISTLRSSWKQVGED